MKDRVSRYPGRVRLTPVPGQANVYDMELADSPSVAGTPLNKANLLTDATATAMGLTSSATPNTAFNRLNTKIDTNNTTLTNAINGIKSDLSWTQIGTANLSNFSTKSFSITMSEPFSSFLEIIILFENVILSSGRDSVSIFLDTFKNYPYEIRGTSSYNVSPLTFNISAQSTGYSNQGFAHIIFPNNDGVCIFYGVEHRKSNSTSITSDIYTAVTSVTTSDNKIEFSIIGNNPISCKITVYGRPNP